MNPILEDIINALLSSFENVSIMAPMKVDNEKNTNPAF